MSLMSLPARTDGPAPPEAASVAVELGHSFPMRGVSCVVCGRPVMVLVIAPPARIIHHVDARYPCYTHYGDDRPGEEPVAQMGPRGA